MAKRKNIVIFRLLLSSNSLVLDPRWAFWADPVPFKGPQPNLKRSFRNLRNAQTHFWLILKSQQNRIELLNKHENPPESGPSIHWSRSHCHSHQLCPECWVCYQPCQGPSAVSTRDYSKLDSIGNSQVDKGGAWVRSRCKIQHQPITHDSYYFL